MVVGGGGGGEDEMKVKQRSETERRCMYDRQVRCKLKERAKKQIMKKGSKTGVYPGFHLPFYLVRPMLPSTRLAVAVVVAFLISLVICYRPTHSLLLFVCVSAP